MNNQLPVTGKPAAQDKASKRYHDNTLKLFDFGRGKVHLVNVVGNLDLSRYRQLMELAEKANATPETTAILVNLGMTKRLFDSGKAVLQLLRKRLESRLRERLLLINASPEIAQNLQQSFDMPRVLPASGDTGIQTPQ